MTAALAAFCWFVRSVAANIAVVGDLIGARDRLQSVRRDDAGHHLKGIVRIAADLGFPTDAITGFASSRTVRNS